MSSPVTTKADLLQFLVLRAKLFREDTEWFTRNKHMHAVAIPISQDIVDAVLTGFINDIAMRMGVDYGMYSSDLKE